MEVSRCSRKRPSGGAVLHHQEAQCQPPACKRRCKEEEEEEEMKRMRRMKSRAAGEGEQNRDPGDVLQGNMRTTRREHRRSPGCKRRCREEEEMKRRRRRAAGGGEENRDPGDVLQGKMRTVTREHRRFPQSGTRTRIRTTVRTGSGFKSISEVQSCRPEVRVALIKKTRIQTSVRKDWTDPGSTETQLDQKRPTWIRQDGAKEPNSEVRSAAGPLRAPALVSDQPSESRTRSDTGLAAESCRGEGDKLLTRTKIRRRTKIHPSVFKGRGQLWLSITPEAGQLIIHIHEARGLMGKSSSCDSYVKLMLTSDLGHSITKTPTVLNNKNPKYNHTCTLCISDDVILDRLLVSVLSRRSHLIGCMSFGISSHVSSSKLISGWFYLLGEGYGRNKHLRVISQRNKPMRSLEDEQNVPKHYADLRRTPDSTPDTDLNHISTTSTAATTSRPNSTTTAGLRDLTNHSQTSSLPQSLDPTNANHGCIPANANHSSYISTLYSNTNQHQVTWNSDSTSQKLTVSVVRGKDGFGFTICSDCPVKVQAVDSGGPAYQSGLRQGDSVLQLNGLPVETWRCADLAHAIRSCPTQIVLVVWRGLPELRSGCEALLRPPAHITTTGRKLLPHPAHSKHGRRRGQGLGVRSSLGALGSLWRDKKEDKTEEVEEDQEVTEYSPRTTTLKGTRVTSSHGDNYIILSPVGTEGQLLQSVYHDRNGTIGRLYQTHPSRGQNLLHDPRPGSSQRPFTGHTSTLPPTTSTSSSAPASNYGNYQNCTIVQSHLPCSSYGTYVTLAPKTLIFPIFVQPLDLCSPDRTLLMAEEMVLHQADLLPAKVTVLIYSDLLLFTREDEAGHCNVLQSPLYLNTLQLREVSSEPLHIYFLQSSQSCWRCLFSLEAFSIEQKVRVSLCLHDNIQLQQLVTTDTGPAHQLSDLPSDFGLLSLRQSDVFYRPSSPYSSSDPPLLRPSSPYSICDPIRPPSPSPYYSPSSPFSSSSPPPPCSSLSPYATSSPPSRTLTASTQLGALPPPSCSTAIRSPVWKERGGAEEGENRKKRRQEEVVEERQQGEGESASETSESMGGGGGRGFHLSPHHFHMKKEEESDEEGEEEEGGVSEEFRSTYRPQDLRRSLSEGSLLREPRSPRFLSDSTIHRLTHLGAFDLDPGPRRPSIHTLRKQLTKEGGSLHHMLLLLNGTKDAECRNLQLKKKTKSIAADVRSRLPFLQRRKNSTGVHGNSLEKALRNTRPSTSEVLRWAESLEALLTNKYGLAVFRHFLRSEFSEENLDFWLAVEKFKRTCPLNKMAARAMKIYDEFISTSAAKQVNVDSTVRERTNQILSLGVSSASFQLAQDHIFSLMECDSYPRFLRSRLYAQLANQGTQMPSESTNC